MSRPAMNFNLFEGDFNRINLETSLIIPTTEYCENVLKRANILLMLDAQVKLSVIAVIASCSISTILDLRFRYLTKGIDVLYDDDRSVFDYSFEAAFIELWEEYGNNLSLNQYAAKLNCSRAKIKRVKKELFKNQDEIRTESKKNNLNIVVDSNLSEQEEVISSDEQEENVRIEITAKVYKGKNLLKTLNTVKKINDVDLDNIQTAEDLSNILNKLEENVEKIYNESSYDVFNYLLNKNNYEKKQRKVKVESSLGRFEMIVPCEVCTILAPNEHLMTDKVFKKILNLTSSLSYNKSAEILNDMFKRINDKDKIKETSINHFVSKYGNKIRELEKKEAENIIKNSNENSGVKFSLFEDSDIDNQNKENSIFNDIKDILYNRAFNFIMRHNEKDELTQISLDELKNLEDNPLATNYMFVDDVFSPHQKEHRKIDNEGLVNISNNSDPKKVKNSTVFNLSSIGCYANCADSLHEVLNQSKAYLINNNLEKNQIVTFTDGAKNIPLEIESIYGPKKNIVRGLNFLTTIIFVSE